MAKMMLIDTSKCIGCKACQIACQQWNQLPAEDTSFTGTYQNPPDMSGASPTVVKFTEAGTPGVDFRWLFFKDQCRHCKNPGCVINCPIPGACVKLPSGIVRIDPNFCTPGVWPCNRQCQTGCPFDIPKDTYVKNAVPVQSPAMMKCDMCYDRYTNTELVGAGDAPSAQAGARFNGQFNISNRPACELVCPVKAIKTARKKKIVKKAFRRKRWLKNHGYPQAMVYGDTNTVRVLWILTHPHTDYGLAP